MKEKVVAAREDEKIWLEIIKNFSRKIKYNVSLDEPINDDGGCLYDFLNVILM